MSSTSSTSASTTTIAAATTTATTIKINPYQDIHIDKKIEQATEGLAASCAKSLYSVPPEFASIIVDYIKVMRSEVNPVDSYRRDVIGVLTKLVKFHANNRKNTFKEMTREDVLSFLDSFRKTEEADPLHKWIGTYSGKDMDRDIIERIEKLTGWTEGDEFDFERIAVEIEHIQQYGLPPMPEDAEAVEKYENDPKTANFEADNGGIKYAVELDAMAVYAPNDYIQLIQRTADEFFDEDKYDEELKKRSSVEYRKEIRQDVYDTTQAFLDNYDVDDVGSNDSDDDDNPGTSDTSGNGNDEEAQ